MIPADVASRLRLVTPDQPAPTQAAVPAKQLTDVLSDLVPGQRIMAEIQALLPNGAYRAMVAQRDVTLALPFSAKPGDALELEVMESDGKLTLAFVANKSAGEQSGKGTESVSATLSQTGKLIGDLLGGIKDQGKGAQATPLNGNQPLLADSPGDAAQLAPLLKEAITKSGMFYEAHQARWVEGKLTAGALLQEPQGKLSTALPEHSASPNQAQRDGIAAASANRTTADSAASASTTEAAAAKLPTQSPVASDLAPLVRQQLDALASQNYVWQGQVWPGQQMQWEIEPEKNGRQDGEATPQQWRTRLKLTLPGLGGIDATMRLQAGGLIDIALGTSSDESRQKLAAAGEALRQKLQDAGLNLVGLVVRHEQAEE
ncbi:MAG TPA: flagellar hook-length control protein FliK [Rhodocyclaceae bacterium]|nr:flagellar hook-length control protein FliK [Rhodocyclaceae bacterium]